ncbi:MAG: hypothetical protein ACUZ8H_05550 [Candidatus Anammoxibacter sp.]
MRLAGHKADYINPEREKLHESIRDSHNDEDIKDIEKMSNKYLEEVRSKYG